ncbi:hypothetical protein INT46_007347 [Mucor plumbeus]|uniref:SWIM-type domain-containing protein n=1 Tax=Mucor plumbeus TaxID=97098 RepID=A0A8H7QP79_9FUNG|nr:hypothetical protein INT46_007347 [Mucor plumbeus]
MSETSPVIYSVANIKDALSVMPSNQSNKLPLDVVIYVRASVWEACLLKINEHCGTKWTKLRKWKSNDKVIFGETRQCHRSESYKSKRSVRIGQKDSKRCGCVAQLSIARYHENVAGHLGSDVVEFKLLKDYTNHVSGDSKELGMLPINRTALDTIKYHLTLGNKCRSIRIATLKTLDTLKEENKGSRRPKEVKHYNWMKDYLYRFRESDIELFLFWLNNKLALQGYKIFAGNPLLYSQDTTLFAYGFQSQIQSRKMEQHQSFCLDATHVKDLLTEKGYPVAYMVTNDQSVGPVNQWLVYLRDNCNFAPTAITIDCSLAEVNAIKAAFRNQVVIYYCAFHVWRAWKDNLGAKLSLPTSISNTEATEYKQDLLNDLHLILVETRKNALFRKIEGFKLKIENHTELLDYFTRYWFNNEEVVKRWGAPFVKEIHKSFVTNNYIESWHNQLKVVYFERLRINRLDRLVFVLTNDVEYYFAEEYNRIIANIGRLGPLQNNIARKAYMASQISNENLISMIRKQQGSFTNADNNNNGPWKIQSFDLNKPRTTYQVRVINNVICTCLCPDFKKTQIACKHMRLLKRYTSMPLKIEVDISNGLQLEQDTSRVSEDENDDVNIEDNLEDNLEGDLEETTSVLSNSAAIDMAFKRDIEKFKTIPGVNAAELELLNSAMQNALDQIESIRSSHPSFFRRQNRQWN